MKKLVTIITILFSAALISSTAFAWWGGGMMNGNHGYYTTSNSTDRQAFYDATQDLRASLAADQAELDAIRTGNNPDPARVSTLTKKIVKEQDRLRVQAKKYNVARTDGDDGYCPYSGYGHRGGGHMMGWN